MLLYYARCCTTQVVAVLRPLLYGARCYCTISSLYYAKCCYHYVQCCCTTPAVVAAVEAVWPAQEDVSLVCPDDRVVVPESVTYAGSSLPADCVLRAAHVVVLEKCFRQPTCTSPPPALAADCPRGTSAITVRYECVESEFCSS